MRPRLPRTPARPDERGYIAVTTGLILIVLMGFSAFAVDVGNWYLTGQRAQRAADAAALAGVTKLPGNQVAAVALAKSYSANNGFKDGTAATTVDGALSGGPTRLRVDVTRTVDNIFGPLLGRPQTTISRYAVADFAGPVPLGSPCNRFGDDPDSNDFTSQHQLQQIPACTGRTSAARRPPRSVATRSRTTSARPRTAAAATRTWTTTPGDTSSPSPCASP